MVQKTYLMIGANWKSKTNILIVHFFTAIFVTETASVSNMYLKEELSM